MRISHTAAVFDENLQHVDFQHFARSAELESAANRIDDIICQRLEVEPDLASKVVLLPARCYLWQSI